MCKKKLEVDVRWYFFRDTRSTLQPQSKFCVYFFFLFSMFTRIWNFFFLSFNAKYKAPPFSSCLEKKKLCIGRMNERSRKRKIHFHSRLRERESQECNARNFYDYTLMMFTSRLASHYLSTSRAITFPAPASRLPLTRSRQEGKEKLLIVTNSVASANCAPKCLFTFPFHKQRMFIVI